MDLLKYKQLNTSLLLGIYQSYFQEITHLLDKDISVKNKFEEIIWAENEQDINVTNRISFKLISLGLVVPNIDSLRIRNKLFKDYFRQVIFPRSSNNDSPLLSLSENNCHY